MNRRSYRLIVVCLMLIALLSVVCLAEEEEYPDFDLDALSQEEFDALIAAESMDDGGFEAFALQDVGEDTDIDAELLADQDFAEAVDPDEEDGEGEDDFDEAELSEEDRAFIAAIEEADAQADIVNDAEQEPGGMGVFGIILIILLVLGGVFLILYVRYKRRQARRRRLRALKRRRRS